MEGREVDINVLASLEIACCWLGQVEKTCRELKICSVVDDYKHT
jgi:hypothetical protein